MKLYVGFNMLASREQWTSFAGGIILKNEFFIFYFLCIGHMSKQNILEIFNFMVFINQITF